MAVNVSVLDPRGVEFLRWAASVTEDLESDGVMQPGSEEQWVPWALSLLDSLNTNSGQVPDPRGFDNWRGWAEQFVQGLT